MEAKHRKKHCLSLRWRLTLITASVLLCMAAAMTAGSMLFANSILVKPVNSMISSIVLKETDMDLSASGDVGSSEGEITGSSTVARYDGIIDGEYVQQLPDSATVSAMVTTKIQEKNDYFNWLSLAIMAVAVLAGVLVIYLMAGRALRPVTELDNKMAAVSEENLAERVEGFDAGDEISHLANSFNQMLDKLERSFSVQKRFAANAAHELKTPLAVMKTNLDVLEFHEKPALEDYQQAIEVAKRSTARLSRLIDDLLSMSHHKESQCIRFDSGMMIEEVCSELNELARTMEVTIVTKCESIELVGNQMLLYRAMFNIVENAVKYNRQGGEVEITSELEGKKAIFTIADRGTGISAEATEHIFEAFYRVDKSRSRKIAGSGLGLSIVDAVVKNHGGSVRIVKSDAQGTVVELVLPVEGM